MIPDRVIEPNALEQLQCDVGAGLWHDTHGRDGSERRN